MATHDLSFPPALSRMLSKVKATIWFRIGALREDMSDNDAALSAFEKSLSHNPANASASARAGQILLKKEHFARAIEYLDISVRRDPSNATAWAALAHCHLMTEDLENAYAAYHTTLHRNPHQTEPNLWFGIGVLYDRLGMLDNALEAFHSVLTVTPNYQRADEVYYAIGLIYKEQHKYERAHEFMTKVISVINTQQSAAVAEAFYQIGHIHELAGSVPSAIEAYQRSLTQNSTLIKCLKALAVLLSKTGKHEEAISLLQRASRLDTNDANVYYIMGRVAMASNNYHVAYERYQQAVYRDGKNADFWCAIGVLYFHMRQYPDAMDAYTRAIRINASLPEVWYDMGTLYELYTQYHDAIDAYQHALRLQANDPLTTERLSTLERALANRVQPPTPSPVPRTAGPVLTPNPASAMREHFKSDVVVRVGPLPPPPRGPIAQPPPPPPPHASQAAAAAAAAAAVGHPAPVTVTSPTASHLQHRHILHPSSSTPPKLPVPPRVSPLASVVDHSLGAQPPAPPPSAVQPQPPTLSHPQPVLLATAGATAGAAAGVGATSGRDVVSPPTNARTVPGAGATTVPSSSIMVSGTSVPPAWKSEIVAAPVAVAPQDALPSVAPGAPVAQSVKHEPEPGARRGDVDVLNAPAPLGAHNSRSPPQPKNEAHPIGPRSPNVGKTALSEPVTLNNSMQPDNAESHSRAPAQPLPVRSVPSTGISSLVHKRSLSPPRRSPTFQEGPDRQDAVQPSGPGSGVGIVVAPPSGSHDDRMDVSPSVTRTSPTPRSHTQPPPSGSGRPPMDGRPASKWDVDEAGGANEMKDNRVNQDGKTSDRDRDRDRVDGKNADDGEGRGFTENGFRKDVSPTPPVHEDVVGRRYDERGGGGSGGHFPSRGAPDNSSRHSGTSSYERKRNESVKRQRRHLDESDRYSPDPSSHKAKAERRRESNGSLGDEKDADRGSAADNAAMDTSGGGDGGGGGGGGASRRQSNSGYPGLVNSGSNGSLKNFDVEEAMLPRLPPLGSKVASRSRRGVGGGGGSTGAGSGGEVSKDGSYPGEGSRRRPRIADYGQDDKGADADEGARGKSSSVTGGQSCRLNRSPERREYSEQQQPSKRSSESKEVRTPLSRPFAFRSVPMPSTTKRIEGSSSGREYSGGNDSSGRKDEHYGHSPTNSRMPSPTRSNHDRADSQRGSVRKSGHHSSDQHKSSESRNMECHGEGSRRRDEEVGGRNSMRRRNEDGKEIQRERSTSASGSGHDGGREYGRGGSSGDVPFGSGAPASFSKSLSRSGGTSGLTSSFGNRRGGGEGKGYRSSVGSKGGEGEGDEVERISGSEGVQRGQKRRAEEVPSMSSEDGGGDSSGERRSGKADGVGRNCESNLRRMGSVNAGGKVHGVSESRNGGTDSESRHNKRLRSINGLSEQSGDNRIRGKEV
ncbi:General transcriptional corepressor ssn6 [Gracilariopsis chorda]|uniref:General transcriptional corepressor ssn6 n=1 Tax=Gracilariopsis chorda TaxID=448386 RepID=A0A2V3IXX3_9FLOR|nr:General transcriptional corepressor ssn6 [Gracilariopsis chorda]|eukprot:PXF46959.1 General transcriptional corepressor ssn6 [Gracilariopsis chorda]